MVPGVRRSSRFLLVLSLRSLVFGAVSAGVLVLACGTSSTPDPVVTPGDSGKDSGRLSSPFRPPGRPCEIVIDSPEVLASPHVPDGTVVTYNSSPPTSGPHYAEWANFQEFTTPLEDGYLVHALEHGAVVLLHQSPTITPDDLQKLRSVRDAIPTDPVCDPAIRVRVIIAPYAKLDVPFAAVAWGWSYKAKCIDLPTLTPFAQEHYNHGTENLCVPGQIH
jgi:hypothetical protein